MHSKSGNVLFLILIAVALFAALSYAVTSSSKGGGNGITKDKAKIIAAEIFQYASQIEQAITKLQLINKCSDTQISFERSPFDGSDTFYTNPNAPSNKSCHIFHPSGGGVSLKLPRDEWMEHTDHFLWYFSSLRCATNTGSHSASCLPSEKDLVMSLYGVDQAICEEINLKMLNTASIIGESTSINVFQGLYPASVVHLGFADPSLAGQRTFCIRDTDGSTPNYYVVNHVVLAR